jgi:asparagine synthase (glutamine-hydrolysing)
MCGILGILPGSKKYHINSFNYALKQMEHRGPDFSSTYEINPVLLGHNRLSIIDLDESSNQPMVSSCGNYTITFNGEIYNYLELKIALIEKGYKFKTKGDTEVILAIYQEFGVEGILKLNGMFAFAIYDLKKDIFYLVRDRLGIKPLYYYKEESDVLFSSEIKGILHLAKDKFKINHKAISSYLSFRYPILNDTFFTNIFSVPPGHYLEVKNKKISIQEYWNFSNQYSKQHEDHGEDYYIDQLRKKLSQSVKYRMISDVPIGAFLSGGVDSSVITAIMAKESKDAIKTFTIGFEEQGYNEFEYASIIAEKYQTDHKEIILSGKNYIEEMEKLIQFKDAPLSVPNEVPLYLMSKELKKDITVVLSGEGADEIFGGYGRIFRSPHDYDLLKKLENDEIDQERKEQIVNKFLAKYLTLKFDDEMSHFMNIYSYISFEDKQKFLSSELDLNSIELELREKFWKYFRELNDLRYTNKMMYAFEKIHLLGLLHRVDTTTMATSVEARVPFVDHELVEFAATIPLKYKLKWLDKNSAEKSEFLSSDEISEKYDIPKYLLKKSFEKEIPKEVLYRKKMGFPVPLNKWFGGNFNEYAKEILLDKETIDRNIFKVEAIKALLNDKNVKENHSLGMKIWMLINLELFFRFYKKYLSFETS